MSMSRTQIVITAAGGSALLLAAAFIFQLLGYAPCEMLPSRALALLGALAAATTGLIGVFHAGVEQKWWEGPTSCTSGDITNLTPEQLLEQIMTAPMVRCDEIPWALAGISMAGWNAIISLFLAGLWIAAARRSA